ncbi:Catalase [Dactylella cylindrospora]|nr:Catalase [Dactylella cylindrospora]
MPLSVDERINATAQKLVDTLHAVFGEFPGIRPAHAKGTLVTGTFTPTAAAGSLSKAQHFTAPSTPIIARFSNSTGIPIIPDTDPNASPRGLGLRFDLGNRKHTDIIAHSTPFFPVKTGEGFLGLLQAQIATAQHAAAGGGSPSPIEEFLGAHPETLAFITAPKPTAESFAGLTYWSVNAFKLINAEGKATYVRYRVVGTAGTAILDEAALKDKTPNFLFEEIEERLKGGPVELKLVAQIAEEGDDVTDATVHWPDSREVVELGTLSLDTLEEPEKNKADQKYIIFDPIPRVDGVEASDDPLLEVRAALYLISGRQRRAAKAE